MVRRQSMVYDSLFGPLLPAAKDALCIDLACGPGNFLYYLRSRGYENALGVDLDPAQIDLARHLGLNAKVEDALVEIGKHSGIGLVSALDFIEHLDKDTAVELLQRILSSLMAGGLVIIRCPCADSYRGAAHVHSDLTHKWGITSGALRRLMIAVGFARADIIDSSLPPYARSVGKRAKRLVRRACRLLERLRLRSLGVSAPKIWASSVYCLAWKGSPE